MISTWTNTRRPIAKFSACLTLILVIGCLLALTSGTANAKGKIQAQFAQPIASDAAPGSQVNVRWTMTIEAGGLKQPFAASEVFVRLVAPDGQTSRATFVEGNGDYSARVEVPPGGIGDVKIGIKGMSPSGAPIESANSDFIVPVVGATLLRRDDSDLSMWLPLAAVALVSALTVLFLLFRRKRRSLEGDVGRKGAAAISGLSP